MKKTILLLVFFIAMGSKPQSESVYNVGEQFVFRIHYEIINAGVVTLNVKEATIDNKSVFHIIGKGHTTGVSSIFFKVNDNYETFIDKETGNPLRFIRKINEGGYTKNQEGFFSPTDNKILVKDYKRNSEKNFDVPTNVQDILSAFYYLRNYPTIDKMKQGESISIDMFFDEKTTKFRLKFMGRENIKTKFGTVSTMIFKPSVQTGRVFKEEESLTFWISDDKNKIPIRVKASLMVGAIKADLESYKGLKYPFKVQKSKQR